jgi:hypothetical protein
VVENQKSVLSRLEGIDAGHNPFSGVSNNARIIMRSTFRRCKNGIPLLLPVRTPYPVLRT